MDPDNCMPETSEDDAEFGIVSAPVTETHDGDIHGAPTVTTKKQTALEVVQKEWRVGASRMKADRSYEAPEEVGSRVEKTHNDKGEKARKGRRRRDVREIIIPFVDVVNDNKFVALRKPTPHSKRHHR